MVSTLSAKLIRGCHPTFSCCPCNDDWHMLSMFEYYRSNVGMNHPHPAKYWKYIFQLKWGWTHSITDFKTQSIKEYILISSLVKKKTKYILITLLTIQRACEKHNILSSDIMQIINEYLFIPYMRFFKHELKNYIDYKTQPISLPSKCYINPLQVFIGRCKQYGIIHPNTNSCIYFYEISFEILIHCCKTIPKPNIKYDKLYIYDKRTFFLLLRCIYKKDQEFYNNERNTPFFKACHCNLSGIENDIFYKGRPIFREIKYLKQPSIIDIWCKDLFGW